MSQSVQPIELCDCGSQSIFVRKSRDRLGIKRRVQNNRYQIVTSQSSDDSMSSEAHEHLISILIPGCRIRLYFVPSHSRVIT